MAARAGEVVARVRGTSKYRVRLRMRGSKLLASCSCPYFSPQGEPCKHLWATLLLAEARGLLQSPPVFPVHLVTESPRRLSTPGLPETSGESGPDRDRDREPLGPGELDLGMEMIGLVPPRPTGPGARAGKPKGKDRGIHRDLPGEPGSWSQRNHGPRDYRTGPGGRSKIKGPGVGPGSGPSPARTKAVNRNAKRLLVYVLDVASTLAQNQVVIDLARRQRKTTGEWGPLRPWYYAPHAAHVKYDPEDRLILALLDEAQATVPPGPYSAGSTGPAPGTGASNGAGGMPRAITSSAASARAAAERALRGCAGSCSERTRRPWSNDWLGRTDCDCAARMGRKIRRQCGGTTVSLGGFRWKFAPSREASGGLGVAPFAAVTTGWTSPSH